MAYETVLDAVDDGVATITLNRPDDLDAWNAQPGAELADPVATADADDVLRAVPAERELWPWQVRQPVIAASSGHGVGVAPFAERREPRWTGRSSTDIPAS